MHHELPIYGSFLLVLSSFLHPKQHSLSALHLATTLHSSTNQHHEDYKLRRKHSSACCHCCCGTNRLHTTWRSEPILPALGDHEQILTSSSGNLLIILMELARIFHTIHHHQEDGNLSTIPQVLAATAERLMAHSPSLARTMLRLSDQRFATAQLLYQVLQMLLDSSATELMLHWTPSAT